MARLPELERTLHGAGEHFHLLPLQGGAIALVTQRGARVLGLFPAPDADNLLWTNAALSDSARLRNFVAGGGWNLGGERIWLAPEIQYNVRDRRDFFGTLDIPAAIDPGQYELIATGNGIRWEQIMTLAAYNLAVGEKRLHLVRDIRPVTNPLPAAEMDSLTYAGYEQTAQLSELDDTPILSACWNLVQLNAGGTLIVPYYGVVEGDVYFGSAPDEALTGSDSALRIAITGKRQFKVGYRALGMTGRMGCWRVLPDGRESLLVRAFFNNPSNLYSDEPPHQPGLNGHSVYVYNYGGEFGGEHSFGEMECLGGTVGLGRRQSTDTFVLWAFVGTSAAIARAALRLLGGDTVSRLGLGSYACAWAIGVPGFEPPPAPMSAFGLLRFADELGLRLVQIADNLPLDKLSASERAALRDEARDWGIAVEVGTRGIETEHLRRYIGIAQEFESPILRVVVDTATYHPTPEEVVTLIRQALPELTTAGIILAIENHDRFRVATLAGILQALDHPNVGICLDTVNSFGALEGPELVVATLGPYVVNLHLKEFIVRRLRHNMGFEVTGRPAGQGMLNAAWLLETLHGFGREFNTIIELWPEPEATMEATIAKELDWVRQSAVYLRTLIKD